MTPFDDHGYGDSRAGEEDAGTRYVVSLLERMGTQHAPPPQLRAALADLLYREARTNRTSQAGYAALLSFARRNRRVAVTIMVLLGAALIAGGTYAAVSVVNDVDKALYGRGSGTALIPKQNLGEQLNLAQHRCGFTMTLRRAYADANRLVIGYTVSGPPRRHFINGFFTPPTLTDQHGSELKRGTGIGSALTGNEEGDYYSYDAAGVAVPRRMLKLRLIAPYIQATEVLTSPRPAFVRCERYSFVGQAMNGQPTRWVEVGPLAFNFTVPVTLSVQVLDLHQTARLATGTVVMLKRMVITPIETRLYLRGLSERDEAFVVLNADGRQNYTIDGVASPVDGLWTYAYDTALYGKHGVWTVKVLTPRHGSIVFHVVVPNVLGSSRRL